MIKESGSMDLIRTSLLLISNTHGMSFNPTEWPLQSADVVIHCGDLTDDSKIDEFRTTIQLLKDLH